MLTINPFVVDMFFHTQLINLSFGQYSRLIAKMNHFDYMMGQWGDFFLYLLAKLNGYDDVNLLLYYVIFIVYNFYIYQALNLSCFSYSI